MGVTSVIPETVEICVRPLSLGYPCLSTIGHRGPAGDPYCYRCGSVDPGVVFKRGDTVEDKRQSPINTVGGGIVLEEGNSGA